MSLPRVHVLKRTPFFVFSPSFPFTRMSCNQGLYCSPGQGDRLFPQQQYSFTWNPQLWSNQGNQGNNGNNQEPHGSNGNNKGGRGNEKVKDNQGNGNLLDIYLFQDQSNKVVQKFANAVNDGQFGFTVDKVRLLRAFLILGMVYDSFGFANTIYRVEIWSGKCRRYAERGFVTGTCFLCRGYGQ
jgi:hypothetical protein